MSTPPSPPQAAARHPSRARTRMLTLYYTVNSPYARKVRVALAEKRIEHRAEKLVARPPAEGRIYPESYESLTPNLRIPMLVAEGKPIWESNLILEYLLRTYPRQNGGGEPPFAPAFTREAHHLDDLLTIQTIETLLNSALNIFALRRDGVLRESVPYLRREADRTQAILDWLEARVTPEGFIPGEFSVSDLNLACALTWIEFRQPVPWRGRPKLERLHEEWERRPAMAATRPDPAAGAPGKH